MTSSTDAVTQATLEASDAVIRHHAGRREDICDLIRAHGLHAKDVATVAYDVVDMPLLRISRHVRNDQGFLEVQDDGLIVRTHHDVPLRTPLPAWWRPTIAEGATTP